MKPFYASVLDEAELITALAVEGVDEELAVLRMRLLSFLRERPDDHELMLRSVNALVRAAGARYRMSAASKDDLAGALGALLLHASVQLFPDDAEV